MDSAPEIQRSLKFRLPVILPRNNAQTLHFSFVTTLNPQTPYRSLTTLQSHDRDRNLAAIFGKSHTPLFASLAREPHPSFSNTAHVSLCMPLLPNPALAACSSAPLHDHVLRFFLSLALSRSQTYSGLSTRPEVARTKRLTTWNVERPYG